MEEAMGFMFITAFLLASALFWITNSHIDQVRDRLLEEIKKSKES